MKLFEPKPPRKPRIEIIPMIDVMLLLLVYYVLSTVAMAHQEAIPVTLPKAGTGQASVLPQSITITITQAGTYYFNQQRLDGDHLGTELARMANSLPGGLEAMQAGNVTINADLSVQHRLVVRAMDELRKLGVTRFGIATDPESKP